MRLRESEKARYRRAREDFEKTVAEDLAMYARQLRGTTEQQYGSIVAAEIEQFLHQLLSQDLLPGMLVLIGYALEDGHDQKMIVRAARAVAMFHAAVILQDDPKLQNAARAGEHAAQIILANLEVDGEVNRRAVSIMNRTLLLMAHAQAERRTRPDLPQIVEWQALERAVNPLHVGMVLAGADCHATDAITPFATELGKALIANSPSAENMIATLCKRSV